MNEKERPCREFGEACIGPGEKYTAEILRPHREKEDQKDGMRFKKKNKRKKMIRRDHWRSTERGADRSTSVLKWGTKVSSKRAGVGTSGEGRRDIPEPQTDTDNKPLRELET